MAQVEATQAWLAKHGVREILPTKLLTVRIGARRARGSRRPWLWQMAGALAGTMSVGTWLGMRRRERDFGGLPVHHVRGPHRPSWLRLVGAWHLASLLITFGGGAALAVTMYFTTAARTYALSWLGALAWAAACCLVILVGTAVLGALRHRPTLPIGYYGTPLDQRVRGSSP